MKGTRQDWLTWGLLVVVSLAVAAWLWPIYFVGYFNDDVIYLSLAGALWRGDGWVDLYRPDHPVHQKYPPLFPLLLSLLGDPRQGPLWRYRLASVLGFALSACLLYATAERDSRRVARWASLALAVNLAWSQYSGYVLSDIPSACLGATLAYLWVRGGFEGPERPRPGAWLALGLFCSLGVWLRWGGTSLLLWLGMTALVTRAPRERLLALVVGGALGALPCLGLFLSPAGYHRDFWLAGQVQGNVVWGNLQAYAVLLGEAFWGVPLNLAGGGWTWVWAGTTVVLAGLALRDWSQPGQKLALMAPLACLLPVMQTPGIDFRFLLPACPMLAWMAARACLRLGRVGVVVLVLALLGNLVGLSRVRHERAVVRPIQSLAWCRQNLPAGAVVAGNRASLWLFLGHPSLDSWEDYTQSHLEDFLADAYTYGATYVVLQGLPRDHPLVTLMGRCSPRLTPLYADGSEQFYVFRLAPGRSQYLQAFTLFRAGYGALLRQQAPVAVEMFHRCLELAPDMLAARVLEQVARSVAAGDRPSARAEVLHYLEVFPANERFQAVLQSL